ncbi:MAG: hypothetical protein WAN14_22905 [Candidatus Acidiferrales bacterium]
MISGELATIWGAEVGLIDKAGADAIAASGEELAGSNDTGLIGDENFATKECELPTR